MFIGRETELSFLQDKYNEKSGQLWNFPMGTRKN